MKNYTLPPGIVKVCAGLVQSATTEPYTAAVAKAEKDCCPNIQPEERARLAAAIKDNLTKPRHPSIAELLHKSDLHMSESTFRRAKRRFCWIIARDLGLTAVYTAGGTPKK